MTADQSLHITIKMGSMRGDSPTKVLVIAGCYGGLSAALNLLDLCKGIQSRATTYLPDDRSQTPRIPIEIKIVDERDGYYHLIGSPLALASDDYAPRAWRKYSDIPALRVPEISFTQGRATSVDFERKVAEISDPLTREKWDEQYDYLIVSTGLRRDWPTVPRALTRDKYLSEVLDHGRLAREARECVVVVGGGAVGIEMAAELKLVAPSQTVKLVHSRTKLLSSEPLPDEFKDRTASVLREQGVELILGLRVNESTQINKPDEKPLYSLKLSDGSEMLAGHVIPAISHGVPCTDFLPQNCLDENGYVNVSPTSGPRSPFPFLPTHLLTRRRMNIKTPHPASSSSHFATGDITHWSGIKRCGSAMAMGHIAAINIHQQLLQTHFGHAPKYVEFPDLPPMIALGVGKQAVCYGEKEGTTWGEGLMGVYFGEDLGFDSAFPSISNLQWKRIVLIE